MKNQYLGFILFCCFAWMPNSLMAVGVDVHNIALPNAGTKIHHGYAESGIAGTPVGDSWVAYGEQRMAQCGSVGEKCIIGMIITNGLQSPIVPSVYYTENGKKYTVFRTKASGIGYSLLVRRKGEIDYHGMVSPGDDTVFLAKDDSDRLYSLDVELKLVFVYTGEPMKAGSFIIPVTSPYFVLVKHNSNAAGGSYVWIGFWGATLVTSSRGCDISGPRTIPMSDVPTSRFPTVGSSAKGGRLDLTLQCSRGVSVSAVMTDQSNTANTGNVLSLTPSSTARGIGIRFYTDKFSGPIAFGPDSASSGSQNQWNIGKANVDGQKFTVPLSAEYVRTGPITIGSANGLASITFSYN